MDPAEQSPCGSPPPSQALSTILAQSTADTAHVTPATTQSQSGHLIEQNVQLDADVPLPNRVSSMNASQSSANIADAMTATSHVQSDPLTPQTNQVTGFNDQSSSHVLPPTQSLSTSLPQPLLGMTDPTPTKDQDQRQSLNQQKNKVTSFNEHMRSSSAPLTQTSSVNLLQSGFKAVDVVRATSHDQTNHLIQQKAMASSSQDSPIVPPPTSRTPSVIDTIETHPATDNQAGGDGVSRAPARQSNKRTASGKRKAAGAPISSHSSDPDLPSPSHKRPATADVHGRTAGQLAAELQAKLPYGMVKLQNGWQNEYLTGSKHAYALAVARHNYMNHNIPLLPIPPRRPEPATLLADATTNCTNYLPLNWQYIPGSDHIYTTDGREHSFPYTDAFAVNTPLAPGRPVPVSACEYNFTSSGFGSSPLELADPHGLPLLPNPHPNRRRPTAHPGDPAIYALPHTPSTLEPPHQHAATQRDTQYSWTDVDGPWDGPQDGRRHSRLARHGSNDRRGEWTIERARVVDMLPPIDARRRYQVQSGAEREAVDVLLMMRRVSSTDDGSGSAGE